jgi:hypothetical protein
MKRIPSSVSGLRRALELWPYLSIAVSITGLAYIALNAADEKLLGFKSTNCGGPSALDVAASILSLGSITASAMSAQ